jgi:DNA-binding CsgD family transcriptional regulator
MRGRGAEFETVLGLLDSTQQGQGQVLLVEGEPGTGKSLLLARAGEEAGHRGFLLVAAAADELSPAPLLGAVSAARVTPGNGAGRRETTAPAPWADVVLAGLEELGSAGPVLITADDVQWADPATMQAFRSMPRLLASYPLSWILAMGTSADAGQAELLFDLLENDRAARITLGPLDLAAQVALVGDVLGAVPDRGLIELAADAAGNPLVLAEAFRGLRDENAIVVRGGHASMPSPAQVSGAHVTSRIEALARHRLKGLSVRARRFVETASILGRSSRLEDVGEMLGESPGALLAALDEALSAYLLMVRADGLAFRHEFIRQAVARMLAEPIQQALHRQFGQMLLARGGSAVPAAYHLLRGARPGDAQALAGLDRAGAELAPFAPQAAAELATGALALTLPSDPGRPARTAAAVRALTAAGQWDEAETLVRSALAVPLPADQGAALRGALASLLALTGRAAEAMTEAQMVLTNSGVPADLRDDATVALLWAWLGLRGNRQVDQLAGIILAEPSTKRSAIVVAAMVALAVARWDSGRITEALELAAQAVRQASERPYETTYFSPHVLLASALIYIRRLDEATAITNSVESAEWAVTSPWPEGTTEILRARIALAAGRLDDADALAQSALRSVQASAPGAGDALAVLVLATVALRRGDLAAAAEYGQRLPAGGRYYGSPYLADGICLVAAQVLEARRGPRAALDFLDGALAGLPEHRSVLLADPASAPWLVRAALAAGDRALAARIVSAINDTARDNPTLAVIRASAEHAEGLLAGDVSRLQHAADQLADPWARACAVEDQGVLLAAAGRDDEAIRCLQEALVEYGRLGARRGVARTRRRLRQLGVRRRHGTSERRPTGGWAGLTDIEQATARLVAEGLTNQQIADRRFISTHTVAFHLRQMFRKLDISSRVDLARIAIEHARPGDGETPMNADVGRPARRRG